MNAHLRNSTDPPEFDSADYAAMVSAPAHFKPSKFVTETGVARRFQQRYWPNITRIDPHGDDDFEPGFIVGGYSVRDGEYKITAIKSMEVPTSFMFAKIRQLIEEEFLPLVEDEFTASRLGSWAFLVGTLNILLFDPAMTCPRHYRQPGEYRFREADLLSEGREPPVEMYDFDVRKPARV